MNGKHDGNEGENRPVISVSCPGGQARQFRVQIVSEAVASKWAMVANFVDGEQAAACAERLRRSGDVARVISCLALPTAA